MVAKFLVKWARQLTAMSICETALLAEVLEAVRLKTHGRKMVEQGNATLAAVVCRENVDAVACAEIGAVSSPLKDSLNRPPIRSVAFC